MLKSVGKQNSVKNMESSPTSAAIATKKSRGGLFSTGRKQKNESPQPAPLSGSVSTSNLSVSSISTVDSLEKRLSDANNELDRLRSELAQMQLKNFQLEQAIKKADVLVFDLKSKLEDNNQILHGVDPHHHDPHHHNLSIVGEDQENDDESKSSIPALTSRSPSVIAAAARRKSSNMVHGLVAEVTFVGERVTMEFSGPTGAKNRPSLFKQSVNTNNRRQSGLGFLRRGKIDDTANRSVAKLLDEHSHKMAEMEQTNNSSKALGGIAMEEPSLSSKLSTANLAAAAASKASITQRRRSSQMEDEERHFSGGTKKGQNRSASFIRKMLAHKSSARPGVQGSSGQILVLPRGGVQINTSIGAIQFGMPPETIKDSMEMGLPVPTIFVVPPERFNIHEGINVSEIEFPAFFNFFVLRKKVRLITYPDTVDDLEAIMQEALLGPILQDIFVDDEFSKFVSPDVYNARPDLKKEMHYFKAPRAPDFYEITTRSLILYDFFDEKGFIDLGNGVKILDDGGDGYDVIDSAKAEAEGEIVDSVRITYDQASSCLSVPPSMKKGAENVTSTTFAIPQFGVTVLGNSHGFDVEGSTSGFVVWVNGQGAMVDPPPHSSMLLTRSGIQPKFVTAIILTHCHADHEVGTIQKMVTEDKVTLMTTTTIFESFLRKYAAVSGLDTEFLRKLVHFRPVFLEEPTYWNGAAFRFFYALHSIPCVGFEVTFSQKRLVYSADTFYDPKGLEDMYKEGVLSKGRLDALMAFPWTCDIVLHEMGVPPIHTPIEALEALPKDYQKNIRLIHIGGKAARDAVKRGFKIAIPGVENTIILKEPNEEENKVLKVLQILCSMDLFRGFAVNQALELLFMASEVRFKEGENIVEKDTPGDKFLIIVRGSASVTFGGAKKIFSAGDYLGEISVITGATRTATVVAEADVVALEVDRYAFDYLLMHDPNLKLRMENLIKARTDGSWRAIARNSLLSNLSASQKTQLQALLTLRALKRGDVIWRKEEPVQIGLLISKGGLRFEEVHGPIEKTGKAAKEESCPLSTGMFIFDMFGFMNDLRLTTTLVCETDMALVFTFPGESMLQFLDTNPYVMLAFLKSCVII